MKILGTLLAAVALGNTLPEDDGSSSNSNTIIMINMNAANVQMNMGDFTDTGASEGIFTDSKSWQYVSPNNREKELGQRILSLLFLQNLSNIKSHNLKLSKYHLIEAFLSVSQRKSQKIDQRCHDNA